MPSLATLGKTPWCANALASVHERTGIQPDIMVVNTTVVNADILNSWKEVATYLGRGIRTVQRWERELALPIRRPRGKSRSPIFAFRPELDRWLQNAPTAERVARDDGAKGDEAKEQRPETPNLRNVA